MSQELNLPTDLRSPIEGGTRTWEEANIAFDLGESLPEFQERSQDQQDWLRATWRTRQRIKIIEALESWQKSN